MWTPEQAYEYHYHVVENLSHTLREAYHYVRKSPYAVTADDLSRGLSINPLSAGALMNELAALSLVRAQGRSMTSHGKSATAYEACHPRDMPPPLPPAVSQSQNEKWRALEQAAIVIQYFLDNHPEGARYLDAHGSYEPEYVELLTLLANQRRSVLAARRRAGDEDDDETSDVARERY